MYYFIVNTKSKSGKSVGIWKSVNSVLKDKGIEFKVYNTKYEGHATELAKSISQKSDEDISIIIVGGDGTINEVLNGITNFDKVKVGIIPAGSGNDLARGLGITGNEKDIIKEILENNNTTRLDLGQVNYLDKDVRKSRIFAISSGIGLDAIVCKKALTSKLKVFLNKLKLGKLTYIILTVETLFSMTTFKVDIDNNISNNVNNARTDRNNINNSENKNKMILEKVIFLANMNVRAEGGGVPMAPSASPYDGKLFACVASGIPKWRTFFCLPLLMVAEHEKLKGFDIIINEECRIKTDKDVVLHADGEYLADTSEIEYKCLKEKLNLINVRM